jgi:ferrochelatase
MIYRSNQGFSHQQQDKIGVLITNLGTPDAPTTTALRRYLKEFLWDPRVVEIPRPLWWLILNGIILRVRPRRSARAYASVWTDAGSPLLAHTIAQAEGITKRLGDEVLVEYAMRYGNPSISSAIDKLCNAGVRKLLILPLYPQYCGATTASTFDAIANDFKQRRWLPELRFIGHYHDHKGYIAACAQRITESWQVTGRPDKLVLSYHGVPKRYLDQGDPYFCECHKTSRLIAEQLKLKEDDYLTTFQSRFGREEWLQPYTDETLKALPAQGVKNISVFCPGFSADCLETLEEIAIENRGYFMASGGEGFEYIPALNSMSAHLDALATLIRENLAGWDLTEGNLQQRESLSAAKGAIS